MLYYIHCADVPLSIPLFLVKYNLLWRIFYYGMCNGRVSAVILESPPRGDYLHLKVDGQKRRVKNG